MRAGVGPYRHKAFSLERPRLIPGQVCLIVFGRPVSIEVVMVLLPYAAGYEEDRYRQAPFDQAGEGSGQEVPVAVVESEHDRIIRQGLSLAPCLQVLAERYDPVMPHQVVELGGESLAANMQPEWIAGAALCAPGHPVIAEYRYPLAVPPRSEPRDTCGVK